MAVAVLVGVATMGGCVSDGDISNPVVRKVAYFSYLNGDDIRAQCHPGADDHLRVVFNGRYNDQVRIYNLTSDAGRPVLHEKILTDTVVNQGFTINDLGSRLSGQDYTTRLSASEARALWSAMDKAGTFAPPVEGTRLQSDTLWWLAVGCHGGQPFFHTWRQTRDSGVPSFFQAISEKDPSGLPFPSADTPPLTRFDSPSDRSKYTSFTLEVGSGGLVL